MFTDVKVPKENRIGEMVLVLLCNERFNGGRIGIASKH
jgi:alkylation response protein AidB-like acyl-CoA dehydrogenase